MQFFGPNPSEVSHADLLEFFKLRHETFAGELGWELPVRAGFDVDQYDFPFARFVLAKQDSRCVGGVRIAPTAQGYDAADGTHVSFMLRDFVAGTIQTPLGPDDLISELPYGPDVWELTRFVSDRLSTTRGLLYRVDDALSALGARSVLTISPPAFLRLLRAVGFEARPISKPVLFADGRHYQAIETTVGRSREQKREPRRAKRIRLAG